ncbi:hypothetical protein O181_076751 [Austropuccinia psidii MF-1]|uniref:Uncharacterized protein n=1 Tax=Austropuccinia psidii MF-1 TaxID=1389203 RepID=A0A9Q3FGU2_9BASI|nr:hypothetical protein [Austropuccinia psidii MF-1]
MCQHCSTQKHSSPEGDRQGVAFTPFQYKQHIKNLKSAISPKSLPKIPTSASRSECPQILLDHFFPAYYSQLTQSTFSTPPVSLPLHRIHTAVVQTFPTRSWNHYICHSIIKV